MHTAAEKLTVAAGLDDDISHFLSGNGNFDFAPALPDKKSVRMDDIGGAKISYNGVDGNEMGSDLMITIG